MKNVFLNFGHKKPEIPEKRQNIPKHSKIFIQKMHLKLH